MNETSTLAYDEYLTQFRVKIKSLGLKNSQQREYVLKVLYYSKVHLTAEQILDAVRQEYHVSIGMATVYNIITLFEKMKILNAIRLEKNDTKVYELDIAAHHDHMVCLKCSKIVEFVNDEIEHLQENIAKNNDFHLISHSMILYGICKECKEKRLEIMS